MLETCRSQAVIKIAVYKYKITRFQFRECSSILLKVFQSVVDVFIPCALPQTYNRWPVNVTSKRETKMQCNAKVTTPETKSWINARCMTNVDIVFPQVLPAAHFEILNTIHRITDRNKGSKHNDLAFYSFTRSHTVLLNLQYCLLYTSRCV